MEKKSAIAITSAIWLFITISSSAADPLNLCRGPQKFASFHVYIQDIAGTEKNATVWTVAKGKWTDQSDSFFGELRVVDGLMTAGTAIDSLAVGRIQGLVAFTDIEKFAVTMNMNFYFTEGRFKGSSLVCLGRNPMWQKYNRDLPIVGGTGKFLNARGYTISNTVYQNTELTYHILEYYIYIVYEEVLPGCLHSLHQATHDNGPFTELF